VFFVVAAIAEGLKAASVLVFVMGMDGMAEGSAPGVAACVCAFDSAVPAAPVLSWYDVPCNALPYCGSADDSAVLPHDVSNSSKKTNAAAMMHDLFIFNLFSWLSLVFFGCDYITPRKK